VPSDWVSSLCCALRNTWPIDATTVKMAHRPGMSCSPLLRRPNGIAGGARTRQSLAALHHERSSASRPSSRSRRAHSKRVGDRRQRKALHWSANSAALKRQPGARMRPMADTPKPDYYTAPQAGDFAEAAEPFALFEAWLADAEAHEPNDPNTMAL